MKRVNGARRTADGEKRRVPPFVALVTHPTCPLNFVSTVGLPPSAVHGHGGSHAS